VEGGGGSPFLWFIERVKFLEIVFGVGERDGKRGGGGKKGKCS